MATAGSLLYGVVVGGVQCLEHWLYSSKACRLFLH